MHILLWLERGESERSQSDDINIACLVRLFSYGANGLASANVTIVLHNNAFQFSEHVSMFETSSSAMNIQ